jgi:putative transposase
MFFDNLFHAACCRLRRQPQPTRAMPPMTRPPEPTPPGMLEFLVWESQIRRQEMPRKRYTPEQIIQHLREAEVLLAQGKTIAQVCKKIGITDQTYYRWRKEYGGIRTDQAKRLKDLAKFNTDFGDRFWGCADTVRAFGCWVHAIKLGIHE